MPETSVPEQSGSKEILLPKNQIRPLARGLSQLFTGPIKDIYENLPLAQLETNKDFQEAITQMRPSMDEIQSLLNGLLTAKEVKLRLEAAGGVFIFSKEKEIDASEEGTVTIEGDFAQTLMRALSHNINTPFSIVLGYSELLIEKGSNDDVRSKSRLVNEASLKMTKLFDPIREADKLEITTDRQGKTSIKV